jgi:nitrile hydratase
MGKNTELNKKWAMIVAKSWADEDYKQRLLSDASAVLKEEGIGVPEGLNIKVLEDTSKKVHLVLPAAPDSEEGAIENVEERLAALWSPLSLFTGLVLGAGIVDSVVDSVVDSITGK